MKVGYHRCDGRRQKRRCSLNRGWRLADLSLLLWGSRLVASPRIRIMERKTHRPDRYHRSHVRTSVDTQLIPLTARMDGSTTTARHHLLRFAEWSCRFDIQSCLQLLDILRFGARLNQSSQDPFPIVTKNNNSNCKDENFGLNFDRSLPRRRGRLSIRHGPENQIRSIHIHPFHGNGKQLRQSLSHFNLG